MPVRCMLLIPRSVRAIVAITALMAPARAAAQRVAWAMMCAMLATSAFAQSPSDVTASGRRNIAILVFDGVQVLDFAGAFEVFSRLDRDNVFLVSRTGAPVKTWRGVMLTPKYALAAAPKPDLIVLPGGDVGPVSRDSAVLQWVHRASADSSHLLTICTGAFIALRAHVLDGRNATTFWRRQEALQQGGAESHVHVVTDQLVVEDGRLITAGGTGIEGALAMLGKLHGEAWRALTALHMEVDVSAGHAVRSRAALADRNIPDVITDSVPPDSAVLIDYSGGRDSWNMHWRYAVRGPVNKTAAVIEDGLRRTATWRLLRSLKGEGWDSTWEFAAPDGAAWRAAIGIADISGMVDLSVRIWRHGDRKQQK